MDIKSFKGALGQIAEQRGISPEKVIELRQNLMLSPER